MGSGAVLALAAFAVLMRCILAREYIVGDGYCMDVEWDRYCNFQRWALDKDFFVGDTLVFRFSSVSSTVAEVTKADFDGCTKALLPANPIRVHELSPVTVNLSTAGPIYIANTIQSCERQRFVINVNVPTPSPPSDSSTSEAMTSSSTPPPPTKGGDRIGVGVDHVHVQDRDGCVLRASVWYYVWNQEYE